MLTRIFLLSFSLALMSCNAVSTVHLSNRDSTIKLESSIPSVLDNYLRSQLKITDPNTNLFDLTPIRQKFFSLDSNVKLTKLERKPSDGLSMELHFASLDVLVREINKGSPQKNPLLRYSHNGEHGQLDFMLSKENALALYNFLPGINNDVIKKISPPALDPSSDFTESEYYESTLRSIMGSAAAASLAQCKIKLQATTEKPIISATGLNYTGNEFTIELTALQILSLEKPISFSVQW